MARRTTKSERSNRKVKSGPGKKGKSLKPGPAQTIPRALVKKLQNEVASSEHPACLIAPDAGLLVPLNSAGAETFSDQADLLDVVSIDQAMPAVDTLRQCIAAGSDTRGKRKWRKPLLFWTSSGTKTLDCTILRRRAKGRNFVLVQLDRQKTKQSKPATTSKTGTSKVERDDAATLREIARRIRAGSGDTTAIDDVPGELPEPTPLAPELANDNEHHSPDRHQRAKLAHELRTPISAIVSAAEVLKDERLGALENFQYREYARDIFQSARHALELIEKGLNVNDDGARSGAGPDAKQDYADLNDIVQSAVATIKHLEQSKHLTLTFMRSERRAYLDANPTVITQIVLNLLTNAVKFTPAGGSVTAQVFAELGEDVRVDIRDTGPGMTQQDIDRHLNKRNIKPAKPRIGGGLGIGLALSRKLAAENGASLKLVSAPDQGTTAVLSFPLRRLMAV